MGLSTAQLRLLFITGRKHNIELEAQQLHADKLSLATQEEEAYRKYNEALDATMLQIAYRGSSGAHRFVDANYTSVCTFNPQRVKQYHLFNNQSGKVIVPENVANTYDQYPNDKYIFAWAMLGLTQFGEGTTSHGGCYLVDWGPNLTANNVMITTCFTPAEHMVYDAYVYGSDSEIENKYNEACGASGNERTKLWEEFRDLFYAEYADEIFIIMNYDKADLGTADGKDKIIDIIENSSNYAGNMLNDDMTWLSIDEEFAYYVNLWESIHDAGGYEIIASNYESGEEGNEWFQNMIEAGLISLKELKGGICGGWSDVNIATSIGDNFFQEVPDDDRAKRAEVEYEHTLDVIDRKEQKLDTALKKLETEEKALNTQEEGLKQMIKDATENTFNLFS